MELGTALALVGFVDQCIKYGEKLVKKCKAYKNAEKEARELLTIIEHNWMKTGAQLKFLKTIAASLDESYLAMQSRVLSELEGKLKKATLTMKQLSAGQEWIDNHDEKAILARLKSLQNMTSTKKSLYALKKKSLEAIIDDLEKWQTRFDPSWMLLILVENPSINVELVKESKKAESDQSSFIMTTKEMRDIAKLNIMETTSGQQAVWLDTEILDSPDTFETRTNPTLVSIATLKNTKQEVILDTMHCHPAVDIQRTTKEVCNLARVLGKVDPIIFGLLKCRGIIRDSEVVKDKLGTSKRLPIFTFVFDISPNLSNPRNLRSILREAKPYSLNERLELAKKLTHSVLYVHTARFVHKNIRPETIVVFEDNKSEIGAPFLLGFEKIRHEDGQTYNAGDVLWEKNLYRHPSRQGTLPEETYRMQHDIYSLGVILLEIGLWMSFVNYESYSDEDEPTAAVPGKMIAHMSLGDEKDRSKVAFGNKDILETLAGQELPVRMGQRYTDAVLSCLQCLDGGDKAGSKSEFVDEDGLIIGVRFVESILGKVHEISF